MDSTKSEEEMMNEIEAAIASCDEPPLGLEELRKSTCANCYEKGVSSHTIQLLRCNRCKFFRYCSKECQQEHWPKHKSACVQFDLAVQRSTPETMPLFYLRFVHCFIRVDEFLYASRKHRESLVSKIKLVSGKCDVTAQASWVRLPVLIDGNNRHLVVYLTHFDNVSKEPSDQTYYRLFLVGPTHDTNGRGLEMVKKCKRELGEQGVTCTSIVAGAGFDSPGQIIT